jgi:transposase
MNKQKRYPPEVRERAVRMVFEHTEEHSSQWAAICSIAGKLGTPATTSMQSPLPSIVVPARLSAG